jgi:CMP-N-acetylneuraminic acid synthetase
LTLHDTLLDVVALVTARGGSKGIPGKNLVPIGGRPLIAWSIQAARDSALVRRVIVSTDDEAIAAAARVAGAEVPFKRPAELAQDTSSHISVVLHALDWLEAAEGRLPDYLLLLQPTSPLRTAEDVDAAITLAGQTGAASVVSVCPAHTHPYLAKSVSAAGRLTDFLTIDRRAYLRRQDLPPAYALNGAIYLTRPATLRQERTFLPADTVPYVMPVERSLDVDTRWDLALLRLLMEDHACRPEPSASPAASSGLATPASSLRKPA